MSSPTTTFTWTVNTLERTVADGIVSVVHYSVNASDGTYSSSAYGSISLDAPAEGDNVIAYADLTADTCIGWAQDKLGGAEKVTEIQAALQAQIDEQRAPDHGHWNALVRLAKLKTNRLLSCCHDPLSVYNFEALTSLTATGVTSSSVNAQTVTFQVTASGIGDNVQMRFEASLTT